jgi:fluoroacetyl-CoA thioesterase
MKSSLKPGIEHELRFRVSDAKTVPAIYPEAPELQLMPKVFATGFLVGLLEWACIEAVNPHIEWPTEQTVGTHINVSHCAATPPGLEICVKVKLSEVDGRRLVFHVEANDEFDAICNGTHERFVVNAKNFTAKAFAKTQKIRSNR